jgi:hypothetical protein
MKAQLQIKRIEDCMEWLEVNASKYENIQSITLLIEDMGALIRTMAFINNQMAIAKKELNDAKERAYMKVKESKGMFSAPSLVKDYVSAKCSEESYNYDLAERCSRTIIHTIDALRTCISALKVEAQYSNFQ